MSGTFRTLLVQCQPVFCRQIIKKEKWGYLFIDKKKNKTAGQSFILNTFFLLLSKVLRHIIKTIENINTGRI